MFEYYHKKIVVIDDDPSFLEFAGILLEQEKIPSVFFTSGHKALHWITQENTSLILLDFKLLEMTGDFFLDTLRSQKIDIPFIVITGLGSEKTAVKMMKAGALDYLIKDSSLQIRLIPCINNALARIELKETKILYEQEKQKFLEELEIQVTERTKALRLEIEKHRITQKELQQSQNEYQALFENIRDVVYKLSTDGRIISLNSAFTQLTGWVPEDWINHSFINLIHPDDLSTAITNFSLSAKGIQQEPYEMRILRADEDYLWGEFHSTPLIENGKVTGIIGVARNRTDYRKARDLLLQSEKMSAVGTLAGGIAHEFNNINTVILGYTEMVLNIQNLPEQVLHYLRRIEKASKRANNITTSLLQFSRYRPRRKELNDLNQIIIEIVDLLKPQTKLHEIFIELDLFPLPHIFIDPDLIGQVFLNLLLNSIHALTIRDEKLLHIETTIENHYVKIKITDNGCGIPENDIPEIFNPFFTTKGEYAPENSPLSHLQGNGLGLSLSHSIINQHGGKIHAESVLGEYTTISIELPIDQPEKHLDYSTQKIPRILLAGPTESRLQYLCKFFQEKGFLVMIIPSIRSHFLTRIEEDNFQSAVLLEDPENLSYINSFFQIPLPKLFYIGSEKQSIENEKLIKISSALTNEELTELLSKYIS